MSQFEFISVLIAIVLGLAIAHLLRGVVQVIYDRNEVPIASTHVAWSGFILFAIILDWWTLFSWRTHEVWTLDIYVVQIFWAIAHYVIVVLLYPPRKQRNEPWLDLFTRSRRWFVGAVLALFLLDALHTSVEGDLLDPASYPVYIGANVIPLAAGLVIGRPRYHRYLAWYCFLALLIWAFLARRVLT